MKKIGIVILSYNNITDTVECLQSLETINIAEYFCEIIVVDNSDSDKYISAIQSKCSNIAETIRCSNNGYSSGNNVGIKKAIENGCEFIIVLNNDTVVDENFIIPLITELESNNNQIVAPIIYNYYSNKVWSSGGKFRRFFGDYCMLYDEINTKRDVSFISGCCFATTADVFKTIGLLNEDYFMYCEDNDFCKRVEQKGYSMIIIPNSIIFHKAGASSKNNTEFQLYYIYRNRIYFAYSNFNGIYKYYSVFINKVRAFLKAVYYLFKSKKKKYDALIYAIKDGKNIKNNRRY